MPDSENSSSGRRHRPDPSRKEQTQVVEVFAEADYTVLTTNEIAEELEHIGKKQTRRRLDDLVDEGVLATRKPARDRLWWLDQEVEEPITVRYPLLRYVFYRLDVLVTLLGALLGLVGAFAVMLYLAIEASNSGIPLLGQNDILLAGLYSITLGTMTMVAGIIGFILNVTAPRVYDYIT